MIDQHEWEDVDLSSVMTSSHWPVQQRSSSTSERSSVMTSSQWPVQQRSSSTSERWRNELVGEMESVTEAGRLVGPENWTEQDREVALTRLMVANNRTVTKCQSAADCLTDQVGLLSHNV